MVVIDISPFILPNVFVLKNGRQHGSSSPVEPNLARQVHFGTKPAYHGQNADKWVGREHLTRVVKGAIQIERRTCSILLLPINIAFFDLIHLRKYGTCLVILVVALFSLNVSQRQIPQLPFQVLDQVMFCQYLISIRFL